MLNNLYQGEKDMDEVIYNYRKLLEKIDTEREIIDKSIEGDLLERYRRILVKERDDIEKNLRKLYQNK